MASMLETVPPLLETVIYGYFLVVASIGCYIYGRLWFGPRARADRSDDGSAFES